MFANNFVVLFLRPIDDLKNSVKSFVSGLHVANPDLTSLTSQFGQAVSSVGHLVSTQSQDT